MIHTMLTRRVAAAATGGVLAVGGGALAANTLISPASAAPATPAASASPSPSATPETARKHPRLARARHVVHGEFTAKVDDGYQVFDTQRGTVTAVSSSSITIKSPDGFTQTYAVNGDTVVHRDKTTSSIGAVTTNAKAAVLAKVSGSSRTATQIVLPKS